MYLEIFGNIFFSFTFKKNVHDKHPVYINDSCRTRLILDTEKLMLHANFANHLLPLLGVFDQLHCLLDNFLLSQAEHILFTKYKKFLIYVLPISIEPSGLMQFLSTDYKFAISFIILVIVLIVRPTGIFRGKTL